MRTFTDNAGRSWHLAVNLGVVVRIKQATTLNLADPDVSKTFTRLGDEPELIADVLHLASKPEAGPSVTKDDFLSALAGDPLEAASNALRDEIIDFFQAGKRDLLRKVIQKTDAFAAKKIELASQQVDSGALDLLMEKAFANSAGSLPESSESTPPSTRSET